MFAQLLWYIKIACYLRCACMFASMHAHSIDKPNLIWAHIYIIYQYIYNYIYIIYTCRNNYMFFYMCIHIHISCSGRSSTAPPLVPPGNQGFGQGVRVMRDALLARLDGCHMGSSWEAVKL